MWKFYDFSVTQILREINFGEFRGSKSAIFAIFGALNFVYWVNSSLQKVQKFIEIKIQSLSMCEIANFALLRIPKNDFM